MERPQGSHLVLGWNVGGSFSLRMERPQRVIQSQEGPLILGWKDPRGVIQSWDGMTPGGSFSPRMERLLGSHVILGWNGPSGGIQSKDVTTPGESFSPRMERPQGSHSVLGLNYPRGVI